MKPKRNTMYIVNDRDVKALTAVRDHLRGELDAVRVELDAVDGALAAAIARRRLGITPHAQSVQPSTAKRRIATREYGAVTKAVVEAVGLCPTEFQYAH